MDFVRKLKFSFRWVLLRQVFICQFTAYFSAFEDDIFDLDVGDLGEINPDSSGEINPDGDLGEVYPEGDLGEINPERVLDCINPNYSLGKLGNFGIGGFFFLGVLI